MSLALPVLDRGGTEGKASHAGLASVLRAPWTEGGPLRETQAARRGPAGHRHNPSYSLWPSPFLLTFLLQACWEGLGASCCHH